MRGCAVALVLVFWCSCEARDARWFLGGPSRIPAKTSSALGKTHLVHLTKYVTEVLPASCVQVATSLPPCRNMRQLNLNPQPVSTILSTAAPSMSDGGTYDGWRPLKSSLHFADIQDESPRGMGNWRTPSPPLNLRQPAVLTTTPEPPESWAEYFGLSERTVTRTVVHTATAKVRDANVMVTFSITGCHPTRMPFDLPFCAPEPIEQTSSAPSTSTTEEDTVSSTTPFQIHAAEQDQVQFNITDTNAMLSSMISPKFAFQATPVLGVIRHRSDSPQMPHLPFIDPR